MADSLAGNEAVRPSWLLLCPASQMDTDAISGGPINFTFDSGNNAIGVPDGGTAAMLLGAGLSGLALLNRKLVA
jgi:hypothetical protein